MNIAKRLLLLSISAVLFASCTFEVTHFRVASTFNIDLNKKYVKVKSDVSAKREGIMVVYLFWRSEAPDRYGLIGQCLHNNGGDLMSDVKVLETSVFFLVGAYVNLEVRGDVWKQVDNTTGYNANELYSLADIGGHRYLVSSVDDSRHEVWTGNN